MFYTSLCCSELRSNAKYGTLSSRGGVIYPFFIQRRRCLLGLNWPIESNPTNPNQESFEIKNATGDLCLFSLKKEVQAKLATIIRTKQNPLRNQEYQNDKTGAIHFYIETSSIHLYRIMTHKSFFLLVWNITFITL